jgi:bifunctional enzyme CysN/CysC
MITGAHDDEQQQPVSIEERSARFAQTATAINLIGENAVELAYSLERKLFDNGHAVTVLENGNNNLINAIKNAGLLALCVNVQTDLVDISFNCNEQVLDDIYNVLKAQTIIH